MSRYALRTPSWQSRWGRDNVFLVFSSYYRGLNNSQNSIGNYLGPYISVSGVVIAVVCVIVALTVLLFMILGIHIRAACIGPS